MGGRIFGLGGIWTGDIIDYRLASVRVTYGYSTANNIPADSPARLLSAYQRRHHYKTSYTTYVHER